MDTNREFDICWLRGNDYAEVTAPNRTALKNKIMKMSAKGEPGVKVMVINPDGSIVAHVPVEFIKVNKPRKVNANTNNGEKGRKALEEYRARKAAEEAETVDDLPFSDLDEDEDEEWEDEEERDEFS